MSVFIGDKTKRVELAERKDAINPNLLLNSRDFSSNWVIINAEVTSDSYNGGKVVSLHTDGDDINDVRQPIQAMTSQMFTWSVYAKADNAGDKLHTELFGGGGRTDQALTTDWNRYTFQGISDPTKITLYFWGPSGNKGDIQIALPKLEIGNTATSWCPALEDYAWTSDITNLQNTVNQLKGRQVVEAPDFNTLTDTGIYMIIDADKGKNFPTNATWGILAVFNGTGASNMRTSQIYISDDGLSAFVRSGGAHNVQDTWTSWNQIAWQSDITNLQTAIASAGKVKTVNGTQPDNTGNISIAIPDISGKANSTDVTNLQSMITGLSTKVDSLQQNSHKIVPITQADYDALSTKDPNTIYAIGG